MTIRISFAASSERIYEESLVRDILKSIQQAYSHAMNGDKEAYRGLESIRFSRYSLKGHVMPELEEIVEHIKLIGEIRK